LPTVLLTLLILLLWAQQGLGFLRCLLPRLRGSRLLMAALSAWLGLILNVLVLVNAYFFIPACTLAQLAWPVTAALSAISAGLWAWSPRPALKTEAFEGLVLALAVLGGLALLRPLLGLGQLGFYYSNNGEFSNYAAIADAVQYHPATTSLDGPLAAFKLADGRAVEPLRSREVVVGALGACLSALSGRPALWVIQALAAAIAVLAFACIGLLFRFGAGKVKASRAEGGLMLVVFAWCILSAAAQQFWTLSFVSQYLGIVLFAGCLVLQAEAQRGWRRRLALGLALGAMLVAYPDMFVPSLGLVALFELGVVDASVSARLDAVATLAWGAGIAALLANRLGYESLVLRSSINTGNYGWNIYGDGHPVLGLLGSLWGFSNIFSGPHSPHTLTSGLAAAATVAALAYAAWRSVQEKAGGLRGLWLLAGLTALGTAALAAIVARRGLGNTYIVVKFVMGFGWLVYLALGMALTAFYRLGKPARALCLLLVLLLSADLARSAAIFSRHLSEDAKQALFTESEAHDCRALLSPVPDAYLSPALPNLGVVGSFLAYDHDLLRIDGHWPNGSSRPFRSQPQVLLVGKGRSVADDPSIRGPYHPLLTGSAFQLLGRGGLKRP
jgi:hypothetical protein